MRLKTFFAFASVVVASTSVPQAVVAAERLDGATVFRQRCQACHTAVAGQPSRVGPNLAGVVGRKAASVPAFNYSAALKASGLTWTRGNLDRFLQAPARMVPGTRMAVALTDNAQRAAVLTYLTAPK
ncbi:MAG TPA: c-type cytochrome [Sphingobium sp.]|uniref:c-type cytochrome n=1 Tax=Sphingobium sp. TaxID=1912891 RepID=UPI002ED2D686